MTPREAYAKASRKGPDELTRQIACRDPYWAYCYARDVDQCARDDTRAGASKDPEWAYWYARDVDRCARDDTRAGACQDPEWAYRYALKIDRWLHPRVVSTLGMILQAIIEEEELEYD